VALPPKELFNLITFPIARIRAFEAAFFDIAASGPE
jgi:hypothetical protein